MNAQGIQIISIQDTIKINVFIMFKIKRKNKTGEKWKRKFKF